DPVRADDADPGARRERDRDAVEDGARAVGLADRARGEHAERALHRGEPPDRKGTTVTGAGDGLAIGQASRITGSRSSAADLSAARPVRRSEARPPAAAGAAMTPGRQAPGPVPHSHDPGSAPRTCRPEPCSK